MSKASGKLSLLGHVCVWLVMNNHLFIEDDDDGAGYACGGDNVGYDGDYDDDIHCNNNNNNNKTHV